MLLNSRGAWRTRTCHPRESSEIGLMRSHMLLLRLLRPRLLLTHCRSTKAIPSSRRTSSDLHRPKSRQGQNDPAMRAAARPVHIRPDDEHTAPCKRQVEQYRRAFRRSSGGSDKPEYCIPKERRTAAGPDESLPRPRRYDMCRCRGVYDMAKVYELALINPPFSFCLSTGPVLLFYSGLFESI